VAFLWHSSRVNVSLKHAFRCYGLVLAQQLRRNQHGLARRRLGRWLARWMGVGPSWLELGLGPGLGMGMGWLGYRFRLGLGWLGLGRLGLGRRLEPVLGLANLLLQSVALLVQRSARRGLPLPVLG
jgi:hypothetical protein